MKKFVVSLLMIFIGLTLTSCTTEVLNDSDYKPTIMINNNLYWSYSNGIVDTISGEFKEIGAIKKIIKSENKLPEKNFYSTAFNDIKEGWIVYGSNTNSEVIYVYNEDKNQYITFLLEYNPSDNIEKTLILREKAIEDLEYLGNIINTVHPETIEPLGAPKYEIIKEVKNKINTDISIEELYLLVQETLCTLNDAHTTTNVFEKLKGEKSTTVKYLWLQDGLYIERDIGSLKKGDKVLAIGNKTIEDILIKLKEIVSHENLNWVKTYGEGLLNREVYMNYLGIKDDGDRLIYRILRDGKEQLEVIKLEEIEGTNFFPLLTNFKVNNYKILENEYLGILQINKCNFDISYQDLLYRFFSSIKEKNIDNIVIDLRQNTGGNSYVVDYFIKYLPIEKYKTFSSYVRTSEEAAKQRGYNIEENKLYYNGENIEAIVGDKINESLIFHGNIYLLTSKYTFSSGNWFATVFQDNDLGIIVGEQTGEAPTAYGDILNCTLPNSKLNFTISHKKFVRPDKEADQVFLHPDIIVETKIEDILNCIDPQMKKVKELIKDINYINRGY